MSTRQWSLLTAAILVMGMGWTWLTRVPDSAASAGQVASPREGFPAPDFTLQTADGQAVTLSGLRGQPVIVNLWASWCTPCRAEMPALQAVYAANRGGGLVVLGVNSTFQDSEPAALQFAQELGLSFPILLDRDGAVSRRYLLRALPTTFFIDGSGTIRAVVIGGPMSLAQLQSKVEAILPEGR